MAKKAQGKKGTSKSATTSKMRGIAKKTSVAAVTPKKSVNRGYKGV